MTWKFENAELELHGVKGVHTRMKDILTSETGTPVPTVAVMYDYLGDVVWIRGVVSQSTRRWRHANNRSWVLVGNYTERPSLPQLALDIYEVAQNARPARNGKASLPVKYVPTPMHTPSPLADSTGSKSESSSVQEGSESEFSQMLERLGAVHERIRKAHAREEKKNMEKGVESVSQELLDAPSDSSVVDTPKTPSEGENVADTSQVLENAGVERREVEILVNGERINVATPILRSASDPSTSSEHGFRVILEFR